MKLARPKSNENILVLYGFMMRFIAHKVLAEQLWVGSY